MKINSLLKTLFAFLMVNLMVTGYAQTNTGKFVDSRDNHEYKTVTIGNYIWMAENLDYTTSEGSWCYDNNEDNGSKYGRLYNWKTAQNVCPDGWHLPSDSEWKDLEKAAGVNEAELNIIGTQGDGKAINLKEGGKLGFNVLLGGYRLWWDGSFHYLGKYADFWTSTESDTDEAWLRDFSVNDNSIYRNRIDKKYGNSVRCVKNQKLKD